MDGRSLGYSSIDTLSRLIASKEISPVELLEAYLDRITSLDPTLGAYVTVLSEESRRDAKRAEAEIVKGQYLGPLHGVPISLKDLYHMKGVRSTAGSLVLADFVPGYDGAVAARLKQAGAIILGKTNLYEFALGPNTPYHFGITRNPWGLDEFTGASSSGSGVAVAAGLCAASMGTDSGGSVRIPASFCGVAGFKPTYGRISRYGILPLAWSLDTAGPLTRTVVDAAIIMNAVAGHDTNDPTSLQLPATDFRAALGQELKRIRVGVPTNFFFEHLDSEVETAVRSALSTLEGMGATSRETSVSGMEHTQGITSVIILSEAASVHEQWLRRHPEKYREDAKSRLQAGSTLLATDYLKAQRMRAALIIEFGRVMEDLDVLITPTAPIASLKMNREIGRLDGPDAARSANNRLTRPFNLLGWPAISIPCGFSSEGMPIGLQVVGKPFEDELVLRVAHAYEQSTDWHKRRPPIG
jgi:aspartyl-tRNA(Asn)/glutamyl-tRNA(Gln) amidotransferase subunit A